MLDVSHIIMQIHSVIWAGKYLDKVMYLSKARGTFSTLMPSLPVIDQYFQSFE